MALSINTVWEVRTTGDATNGGGWVTGSSGVDRSQQDSPQYAVTDGVANGTTAVTSATANFDTDVVGNVAYIGTARYHITARPSTTEITVDRTVSADTGLTLRIGGAVASVANIAPELTYGGIIWVRAGTYTHSATVTLPAVTLNTWVYGYSATRGDNGRPTINAGANSVWIFRLQGTSVHLKNFILRGNGFSSVFGVYMDAAGGGSLVESCDIANCATGIGAYRPRGSIAVSRCKIHTCTTGVDAFNGNGIKYSHIHDCTTGINVGNSLSASIENNLIVENGKGINLGNDGANLTLDGNIIAYNTGDGIQQNGNSVSGPFTMNGNIIYGNGGWGANLTTWSTVGERRFGAGTANAYGANTSGARNNLPENDDDIALTANPFVDHTTDDWNINDAANGGALLRPEVFTITS